MPELTLESLVRRLEERDYDEAIRLDPTNSVYFDDRGFANGNGFQQVSVVIRTEFDG